MKNVILDTVARAVALASTLCMTFPPPTSAEPSSTARTERPLATPQLLHIVTDDSAIERITGVLGNNTKPLVGIVHYRTGEQRLITPQELEAYELHYNGKDKAGFHYELLQNDTLLASITITDVAEYSVLAELVDVQTSSTVYGSLAWDFEVQGDDENQSLEPASTIALIAIGVALFGIGVAAHKNDCTNQQNAKMNQCTADFNSCPCTATLTSSGSGCSYECSVECGKGLEDQNYEASQREACEATMGDCPCGGIIYESGNGCDYECSVACVVC